MKFRTILINKLKEALRIDRALRFVWQAAPGWTLAGAILLIVQGLLPLLTLYLIKLIVDAVAVGVTAPDRLEAFRHVAILIGISALTALLTALCQLANTYIRKGQSQTVTDHMYTVLHAKSVAVDLTYYENAEYFDKLHRAQQEGPYRPTLIVGELLRLGQNSISLVAVAALLLTFNWVIALVLFLAALPGVLVKIIFARKSYWWQRERTPIERQAGYYNYLLTDDMHAKEVRLFGLGRVFIERFRDLRNLLRREKLALSRGQAMADAGAQAGTTFAVFGAFGYIAYRTISGTITIGDMVMYYQAFQRGLGFLQEILGGLTSLYENNMFLSNFFEFLNLSPRIKAPAAPQAVPVPLKEGIAFSNLQFQYPGAAEPVLTDISFSIKPGEVVALVGKNGSGKTTLIKLLCRLYDPQRGRIIWDGHDVKSFDPADMRQQISVIFQDYVKYHLPAWENIWLGNIDHPVDDMAGIRAAAKRSGADRIISRLPDGYSTVLSKWFKGGMDLSIGEWQMVALARAYLREAALIVLDEPTSALDVRAEHEVFKKFKQLMGGRTAILISHRFSTVKMADRIIVLGKGTIAESGTHDELMRSGGQYAHLYEQTARNYR